MFIWNFGDCVKTSERTEIDFPNRPVIKKRKKEKKMEKNGKKCYIKA